MDIDFCKRSFIIYVPLVSNEWLTWVESIGGEPVLPNKYQAYFAFRVSYKKCHQWYRDYVQVLNSLEHILPEKHIPLLIVSYLPILPVS